jgi:hypothetical protein
VRQKSEQAHPFTRVLAHSTHRSQSPALRGLHNGLNSLKHLNIRVWLLPKQTCIEGRVSGCSPQGPSISHCQRPERQATGVNKLQFCGQVFEIDLHLELRWSMMKPATPRHRLAASVGAKVRMVSGIDPHPNAAA